MSQSLLALDVSLIPEETKTNTNLSIGTFSNDGRFYLISGYENGKLTHPEEVILSWLKWTSEPERALIKNAIMASAIEYSREEFRALRSDVNSAWFAKQEVL